MSGKRVRREVSAASRGRKRVEDALREHAPPQAQQQAPQQAPEQKPPRPAPPSVEVRRSARRARTVSAYREGERTVVLIPARMSRAEERRWVEVMVARLSAQEQRRRPSDADLLTRARGLSERYLGGRAQPSSVRWASNQSTRWGSCTPADGSIRLSTRLRGMPGYVVDYVLVHELAHLLVPGHGKDFWDLVAAYPKTDRARGFLDGVAATAGLDLSDTGDDEPRD